MFWIHIYNFPVQEHNSLNKNVLFFFFAMESTTRSFNFSVTTNLIPLVGGCKLNLPFHSKEKLDTTDVQLKHTNMHQLCREWIQCFQTMTTILVHKLPT